jgi:hypothetical protein
MNYIDANPLQHNTVQSVVSEWDSIVKNPPYQRNGDVWSLEKKQLLIDSIINRYDIPKIYFHKFSREHARKTGEVYAVIDGRQRLEAIFQFIEGKFALSDNFKYLEDPSVKAAGMSYNELGQKYPKVKSRFDSFSLPIVTVETDDMDLIEEMFSRLNEAVPLNAAEKRRAIGGDMVKAIDELSKHQFFAKKVKFGNRRYQHMEAAVRLLFLKHNLDSKKVVDTKKVFLDQFAEDYKAGKTARIKEIKKEVGALLDDLSALFLDKDGLLMAQAAVPIYVFVYSKMKTAGKEKLFTRSALNKFNAKRIKNREIAEEDITKAEFEFLEFDKLSLQGTNDANSIRERWRILREWLLARAK